MAAIARRVHEVDERALVIAESGLNDPRVMRPAERGGYGCDAAWADDFHHALRVLLTGEREGYYAEFGSVAELAKAFHRPHVHDGGYSAFRRRRFGAPADDVPPSGSSSSPRTTTRSATAPSATGCREQARPLAAFCTLLSAVHADAVHGRGVRRAGAVPVLLRPHRRARSPTRRARAAGASSPPSPQFGRGDPRPAGAGDVRALEADARSAIPSWPGCTRSCWRARREPARRRRRRDRVRRAGALAAGAARAATSSSATSPTSRGACRARAAGCVLATDAATARSMADTSTLAPLVGGAGRMTEVWPGRPFPLGATWDGEGTNFSLFSEHAERVELCLFDDDGRRDVRRDDRAHGAQLALLPARRRARASATAIRVHGPYAPQAGHRFNPSKLLIDPYAKAIDGVVDWDATPTCCPTCPPARRTPTSSPTTRTTRSRSRSRS